MPFSRHTIGFVCAAGVVMLAACCLFLGFQLSSRNAERDIKTQQLNAAHSKSANTLTQPVNHHAGVQEGAHPFPQRHKASDFPKNFDWINTAGPMQLADLRGKFVVLDFWTYCCINCIHILPELKKLEHKYPNQIVVIGVHSAKFTTEENRDNIAEAVVRYDIEHPVVVDRNHRIWNDYNVQSWPSLRVIDPEGNVIAGNSGEIRFATLDAFFKKAFTYYRKKKVLDETPLHFELLTEKQEPRPLFFPGKILADEATKKLYITDSNHHRIVVTDLNGKLLTIIGSGEQGSKDGDFESAQFHHPQGCALLGNTLYVADTENHTLRKVNLDSKRVTTIAGKGVQAEFPWPRPSSASQGRIPKRWVGTPRRTALNSPWALWANGMHLYIAMAGPHQIWRMTLDEKEIEPFAGNSREDIVDGRLLPSQPYEVASRGDTPFSSFAQPSGLTSDGTWLFVADSEGSSIRAVPFDRANKVRTLVGSSHLPNARLFTFGDRDGVGERVLLQHPLGVTWSNGKIYIADTYNNKIKTLDAKSGKTQTLAGDGKPGKTDSPARFDEPAGLCFADGKIFVADTNNHLIRVVDPSTGATKTLNIDGLEPPKSNEDETVLFKAEQNFKVATQTVRPKDGKISIQCDVTLPQGWKLSPGSEPVYWIKTSPSGPISEDRIGPKSLPAGRTSIAITVPVQGKGKETMTVGLEYQYCRNASEGVCRLGSISWQLDVQVDPESARNSITLKHTAKSSPFSAGNLDFGKRN